MGLGEYGADLIPRDLMSCQDVFMRKL